VHSTQCHFGHHTAVPSVYAWHCRRDRKPTPPPWITRPVTGALPVQLQRLFAPDGPEEATLPPESFQLIILQIVTWMHDLSIKLAVWSDNIFVPDAVSIPLLGGQIAIDHMTARHLLQPHRQPTLPRLRHVDLQQLQRCGQAALAGILEDFSPPGTRRPPETRAPTAGSWVSH
jgi:hypothetical protein